jgi:hypothetical protein
MITYGCPHCGGTMHSQEAEIGTPTTCPHCQASTLVPKSKGSGTGMIVALISGLMIVLIGCPMLIVISLAAISVMGTKASGTFTSVGTTIGGS